jgi:hypothetical protein
MRLGSQGSDAIEKSLRTGKMLDESAMAMLARFEKIIKESIEAEARRITAEGLRQSVRSNAGEQEQVPEMALSGELDSLVNEGRFGGNLTEVLPKRQRTSNRESKQPKDNTSWRSAAHEQLLQSMRVSIEQCNEQKARPLSRGDIYLCLHTLATGSDEDFRKLRELDILNRDPDAAISMHDIAQASWRNAIDYTKPKSVKDAVQRPDGEGEDWWTAICEELDWFIENGKVEILHKDSTVPASDIPPYKWNKDMLIKLRLSDLDAVERLSARQEELRKKGGGTVDQCFDILKWTWDFNRKMPPLLDELETPTGLEVFKKCRARACLMGCDQVEMHTYDPLRVSAAVVHPASFHIINIIIVNFGLMIFKVDDPKAFCKGDADYPIFSYCPRGVEHVEEYAPHGKDTRWRIIGAIYGLIQASLRYFLKSADVMKGIGFIQCPFDKTAFIKWFESQERFLIFWQHVDDRWGGCQSDADLQWFLEALAAQLQSAQEKPTDVLGLDVEYKRGEGIMRLRATTKIRGSNEAQ